MAEEKVQEVPKKSSGKLKMILMIVALVANFSAVGYGAFMAYAATIGHESVEIREEIESLKLDHERKLASETSLLYTMDPYVVNLDGFPKRSIRMTMTFDMLDEKGYEEVVKLGSAARDGIVKLLSSKRYEDLESIQGKLVFKNEVVSLINKSLTKGLVRDIYFSDFIVQ